MKLVDADLLKAELGKELEKFARENENCGKPALFVYIYDMYLRLMAKIDTLPSDEEEPVSEFMNIESMIESYKQRLISQANGVKNSPLIDMCLASYKHGINETLDTLNLSNVERTEKNWKEPVSDDFKKFEEDYLDKEKDVILCVYDRHAGLVDGANWQKVKTIKSACEYLQQHREEVQTEDNGIAGWINNEFIDNFRKTMELS